MKSRTADSLLGLWLLGFLVLAVGALLSHEPAYGKDKFNLLGQYGVRAAALLPEQKTTLGFRRLRLGWSHQEKSTPVPLRLKAQINLHDQPELHKASMSFKTPLKLQFRFGLLRSVSSRWLLTSSRHLPLPERPAPHRRSGSINQGVQMGWVASWGQLWTGGMQLQEDGEVVGRGYEARGGIQFEAGESLLFSLGVAGQRLLADDDQVPLERRLPLQSLKNQHYDKVSYEASRMALLDTVVLAGPGYFQGEWLEQKFSDARLGFEQAALFLQSFSVMLGYSFGFQREYSQKKARLEGLPKQSESGWEAVCGVGRYRFRYKGRETEELQEAWLGGRWFLSRRWQLGGFYHWQDDGQTEVGGLELRLQGEVS